MTDRQIEESVLWELDVDPQVRATQILVDVEEGIVTLSGCVDADEQRTLAERAAKRVYGVRAVADELAVKRTSEGELSDTDLAREAVWALEIHNRETPADWIQVTVGDGWITLEGEVDWSSQKEAAEEVVGRLPGLRGITNLVVVRPHPAPAEAKAHAGQAMGRNVSPLPAPTGEETNEFWELLKGSVTCP